MSEEKPAEKTEKNKVEDQPPAEGGEAPVQEVEEILMGEDEFYGDHHLEKVIPDSSLSKRCMQFYACFGQTSYKRYNFHWLGEDKFIFATGNVYQILDVNTGEREIFHSKDTDGVGSIAVHPSKKYFAVGEKGTMPNIYIYEYPSLKLYRILKNGTETMFAHVEFSKTGNMLASVGGAPDYTLTVWNWLHQKVILKAKAFSQEVFKVSFSPFTDDILFTTGQTHIRFWKMAKTFTGLKLQCETAKFGQLELSDVSAIYELPDGKVVSGTEQGTLIVWEGQFVKSHLMLDVDKKIPLHDGMIEVLFQEGENFVTAGEDGFIKWWNITKIDSAEAEEGLDFAIQPVKQIRIADSKDSKVAAKIINITRTDKKYYIQDARGRILVLDKETDQFSEVYKFTEGAINALATSPSHNYVVSVGQSGQVKVWDYAQKTTFHETTYEGAGTCICHFPHTDINKGRVFAVGFDNGIIRFLAIHTEGLDILKAFKAHDDAIVGIKHSKDLKCLVTASSAGDIFFFDMDGEIDTQNYEPLCTIKLPDEAKINDFKFCDDDQHILFACQNGNVYRARRPNKKEIDNADSYLWENPPLDTWTIKLMDFQMKKNQKKDEEEEARKKRARLRGEIPMEDEEEEEVWEPQSIRTIQPFRTHDGKDQFIIASEGQFNGFLYIGDFNEERPVRAIKIHIEFLLVTFMSLKKYPEGEMMTIGYDNGLIEIVMHQNFERRLWNKYHDGKLGSITAACMNKDDNFFMTASQDGLIYLFQFDRVCAMAEAKKDYLEGIEGVDFMGQMDKEELLQKKMKEFQDENPPVFAVKEEQLLDEAALAITIKNKEPTNQDIEDANIYSIQQSKLRTEEDHRMEAAEKKKTAVRNQINRLREWFNKVIRMNEDSQKHLMAHEDDFQIDPHFFQVLLDRNDAKIEETKKEVAWGIEFETVKLNKLKNKFYDVLEFEKFTVKGIITHAYVNTFRVKKMSEFLQKNIESFKQMLENEIIGKDNEEDEEFNDEDEEKEHKQDNEKAKEKEKAAALAAKQKAAQQAALDAKKTAGEKKREQRKLEREERKRKIEQLEKKEAMHSGEDPEERKAIEEAWATFGDYKLKQSEDYQVPENQRVNFSKKRQQMVLLEGSIHKLKVDFNQKIQELKVRKKEIVESVTTINGRIHQINEELGVKEDLILPSIDKETEYPENFFEISDKDIGNFKHKKACDYAKEKGKPIPERENDDEAQTENINKVEDTELFPLRKGAKPQITDLEGEYDQIRKIELQYEKDCKKKEAEDIINQFDDEIKEMQKEKYRLESDLKNAEMKLILFFEELILLKSMEAKDIKLTKRLAECRQQKGQILKETNEISRKLREKNKEVDEIKERLADLMEKFHELCPERSEKYDDIRKFFEKIVKRKRRIEKIEKEDGDEDDDDEDGDGADEDEVEEDDDDEDDNGVQGLSQEEYKIEEIEKLREERLDLFEDKEKIANTIGELQIQSKKLENKQNLIKQELEETEEEIKDFQSEKMSKLNQLQVSVVMKVKQVQNLKEDVNALNIWREIQNKEIEEKMQDLQNREANEMNDDPNFIERQRENLMMEEDWRGYKLVKELNKSILFTRTQLLQLINRKQILDDEKTIKTKEKKEGEKDKLIQERQIKENEKLRELREREYNEKQMLRFGNLVDLDNLEVSGPSAVVLELQNKFQKTEKRCIKKIEEAEGEFDSTQRELTGEMKNNTNFLNLIRQLGEEEIELDKKLDNSIKAIFVDEDDEKKKALMEEKLKIKKLLEIQAKEIETFKTEINMYKRKGGHIYTKVTTNRRVANLNQDN